jgi:RND family efflux transporter MFP subunit
MKKINIFGLSSLAIAIICSAPLYSCSGSKNDNHAEEDTEEHHDDDDEGLIILDSEKIKTLGISTEEIVPSAFADVVKVSGEVAPMPGADGVVAARQAGIVRILPGITTGINVSAGKSIASISAKGMAGGDPNETARVAYNAAKRELDRITPLHNEGIVTTREYNAARQRVEEARAAMSASTGSNGSTATAPVSGVITSIDVVDGQYVDAGQTIATVSSNNALSLRADLPETEAPFLASVSDARFRPSYSDDIISVGKSGGKLIAKPTLSSAVNGYIPIYFSLPKRDVNLISGTYCEVYLLGTARENVIAVPESALAEQQGKYFVYVEKEPCHFEKHAVTIGKSDGANREILSGVTAGEKIVVKGTTYVKMAESAGAAPEGHSHEH